MNHIDLITRWYLLRKRGLLMPLLNDGDKVYTFEPTDPWGSRIVMPWDELERLVLEAERQVYETQEIRRRAPGTETLAAKEEIA